MKTQRTGVVFAALAVSLVVHAFAGTISGGDGINYSQAWASRVAPSFAQIGTDRLSALEVPALANLSRIVEAGEVGNGAAFKRLDEQVQGLVSLDRFAAMNVEDKIALLQKAALAAERKADGEADFVLADVPQRLNDYVASYLEPRLEALAADRIYLSGDRQQRVSAALKSVVQFRKTRRDGFETWLRDTPLKISAGAFDGAAHIVKADEGWRIGEHAPTEDAYPSYKVAFDVRLAEIAKMSEGPWKQQALRELISNIGSPTVAQQAKDEGIDLAMLLQRAEDLAKTVGVDPGMRTMDSAADQALRTYRAYRITKGRSRRPGSKEAGALLKHYDAVVSRSEPSSPTGWRILSTLLKGDPQSGYPSYITLVTDAKAAVTRAGRNVLLLSSLAAMTVILVTRVQSSVPVVAMLVAGTFVVFNAFWRAYVAREWQPDFKSGARLDSFRAEIERDRQARSTAPAKTNFILRYAGQSIPAQDLEKIQKLPGVRIIESTSKMLLVAGDETALKDLVADLKDWRMSPEVPVAQADQPPEVEQIRKLPGVLSVEVHVKDGLILVSFQNKASYDAAVRQGLSLPRKLGRYDVAYSVAGVLIPE